MATRRPLGWLLFCLALSTQPSAVQPFSPSALSPSLLSHSALSTPASSISVVSASTPGPSTEPLGRSALQAMSGLGLRGEGSGLRAKGGSAERLRAKALRLPTTRGLRLVVMRDRSSVTELNAGEYVKVIAPVVTRGKSTEGMVGVVRNVWEKCEEDPICCCAENGMEEASIEVEFELTGDQAKEFGESEKLTTYFATSELEQVTLGVTSQN